jgi:type II secretory pathway pseudopilin PulG
MFCPKCGTENPSGATYCRNCGAKLRKPEREENGPSASKTSASAFATSNTKGNPASSQGRSNNHRDPKKIVGIAVVAIVVIILLGIGANIGHSGTESNNAESAETNESVASSQGENDEQAQQREQVLDELKRLTVDFQEKQYSGANKGVNKFDGVWTLNSNGQSLRLVIVNGVIDDGSQRFLISDDDDLETANGKSTNQLLTVKGDKLMITKQNYDTTELDRDTNTSSDYDGSWVGNPDGIECDLTIDQGAGILTSQSGGNANATVLFAVRPNGVIEFSDGSTGKIESDGGSGLKVTNDSGSNELAQITSQQSFTLQSAGSSN